jgi:menaquinone-dependent protoporphyrinogen IX oxidase
MKTLLVYGTRYGATASTSEEIAKVLQAEGFDIKVANAKEEKINDISSYDLSLSALVCNSPGGRVKLRIS